MALALGGCAQFTTDESERAALEAGAEQQALSYLECVRRESLLFVEGNTDAAFVYDAVKDRCVADLEAFKAAELEYLDTRYMIKTEPLQQELDDLNRRARAIIAEQMASNATPARPAAPTAMPAAPVAPRTAAPANWDSDARVYLDCMLEQARRYVGLNESADTIAEVAQNNCRNYLDGPDAGALAQEGRARVLNEVFESRVTPRPGR
jgi:hypothetical protein